MKAVNAIHRSGIHVPSGMIWCDRCSEADLDAFWQLARLDYFLLKGSDLRGSAKWLLTSSRTAAEYLQQEIRDRTARQVIRKLAASAGSHVDIDELCRVIRVPKSTLYRRLRRAGLPGVQRIQVLFRQLRGVHVLQRGGVLEDATAAAGFTSEKAFARALRRDFGACVREICERGGWKWIVERWLVAVRKESESPAVTSSAVQSSAVSTASPNLYSRSPSLISP